MMIMITAMCGFRCVDSGGVDPTVSMVIAVAAVAVAAVIAVLVAEEASVVMSCSQ